MVQLLRPRGTPETSDGDLDDMVELRDRFWSLYAHTWEWQVWRAGAWLFARSVDEHVPPLLSRVVARRKPVGEEAAPSSPGDEAASG